MGFTSINCKTSNDSIQSKHFSEVLLEKEITAPHLVHRTCGDLVYSTRPEGCHIWDMPLKAKPSGLFYTNIPHTEIPLHKATLQFSAQVIGDGMWVTMDFAISALRLPSYNITSCPSMLGEWARRKSGVQEKAKLLRFHPHTTVCHAIQIRGQ